MATDTELRLLLLRIKVKDQQIQDLQKERADMYMEYKLRKAENENSDNPY